MARARFLSAPRAPLYRLGYVPDPLAWPPWALVGGGRYDDPRRQFRVPYAAGHRRTVFLETLAQFRPAIRALAAVRELEDAPTPLPGGRVALPWLQHRRIGRLALRARQRWLDVRALPTRETLRQELASVLLELGLADLDLGGVLGPSRALTQAIARWAFERGAAGIIYSSRLDHRLACWAIFEGTTFDPVGVPEPIAPNDPDLVAVARLCGLGACLS